MKLCGSDDAIVAAKEMIKGISRDGQRSQSKMMQCAYVIPVPSLNTSTGLMDCLLQLVGIVNVVVTANCKLTCSIIAFYL